MVQRYNPDYVMHAARFAPFAREAEHGEFVKFSDYEALVSELTSSQQINAQTLQVKLTMAETIKELTDRVNALAVRNEILTAFLTEGFNIAGKGGSWCGGDIQELGEKLGLFARETYQPALHGYHCGHEPGEDSVYVITNSATDATLAAIQAQGVEKLADKLDAEIEQIMRGAFFYDEISSREAISKMVREFATELREAK
ncbi:TPA: hypothetical protein ACKPZB_001439 [Serratia marcescens]